MHYKLCVIGHPIHHSQSPWIHEQFAKQFHLSISYTKIQPALDQFIDSVAEFKKNNGFGFNVTLPFKQEAYQLATQLSARAAIAKSVNTMMFKANGMIYGDNTDGVGLVTDITQNLNYILSDKTLLILGAGGAVRGILHPLFLQRPKKIIIANRTVAHAETLAKEFQLYGEITVCGFEDLKNKTVDVIIDGTGFHDELSLPASLSLTTDSLCYDLKYGNSPTWAKIKNPSMLADGLGMLVEQAAEAFFVWTGKKPDTQSVIKQLRGC